MKLPVLKGHEFTRAAPVSKSRGALASEGMLFSFSAMRAERSSGEFVRHPAIGVFHSNSTKIVRGCDKQPLPEFRDRRKCTQCTSQFSLKRCTQNHSWQTGFSVLYEAPRVSPPPVLSGKSLFSKTLPLSLLDGGLCEPSKGYPGHNSRVPNTLRNPVPKKLHAPTPAACFGTCSSTTATIGVG
jgi:hypothetical protein